MERPTALISVWDKTGIEELAATLQSMGGAILSTGGTATRLRDSGIEVMDVSEATGHPEIFDGRVKTLHPAVHGGILARRDSKQDMEKLVEMGYGSIDMVCVNLYPFEETAARDPPASEQELIEMIDIGGPAMVRSAAKNHADVIVITNPDQHRSVLEALSKTEGNPSGVDLGLRRDLAISAFQSTAAYDSAVSNELWGRFTESTIPNRILTTSDQGVELRYGENPHQPASFFPSPGASRGLSRAVQHGGKPLSYNNYLDLDAALRLVRSISQTCDFGTHSCVVIKHTNPCGAAIDTTQVGAWENALASDPESAFGCVIAFTHTVEKATAEAIGGHFLECIIAPGYDDDALEILSEKQNRRMLTLADFTPRKDEVRIRQLDGGWVAQVQGPPSVDWSAVKCVTKAPADDDLVALARFGSTVLSEVKSNSIVLVAQTETGFATVGVGPGQTSRVEAVRIAARRAGERARGSMMVSDAFFPFRDGIDTAHEIGVTTVVQPGGSMRDQESIDAADEHGMAMIFTGQRLFLH